MSDDTVDYYRLFLASRHREEVARVENYTHSLNRCKRDRGLNYFLSALWGAAAIAWLVAWPDTVVDWIVVTILVGCSVLLVVLNHTMLKRAIEGYEWLVSHASSEANRWELELLYYDKGVPT